MDDYETGAEFVDPNEIADTGITKDHVRRWKALQELQDRNETLFYHVLLNSFPEMAPIVYTPVVGWAALNFHKLYRRPRGARDFLVPRAGSRCGGRGRFGRDGCAVGGRRWAVGSAACSLPTPFPPLLQARPIDPDLHPKTLTQTLRHVLRPGGQGGDAFHDLQLAVQRGEGGGEDRGQG